MAYYTAWYGTNSSEVLSSFVLTSIEPPNFDYYLSIYGAGGNDTIYGGSLDDSLYGQDGNDTIYGDRGDDHIEGGNGNYILDGQEGRDTMKGGQAMIHII